MIEDAGVKERLLKAGKEEFVRHGFQNASLRKICAKAGVTTGALYFFFRNKEDLFASIVEPPLRAYNALIDEAAARELDDLSAALQNEDQIIRFLMRYREECVLLLEKAEGTRFAGFYEEYKSRIEAINSAFFEKYAPGKAGDNLVKLLVSMRLQGYLELIKGNYTPEEAIRLTHYMAHYADAGFAGLVDLLNQEGN